MIHWDLVIIGVIAVITVWAAANDRHIQDYRHLKKEKRNAQ